MAPSAIKSLFFTGAIEGWQATRVHPEGKLLEEKWKTKIEAPPSLAT